MSSIDKLCIQGIRSFGPDDKDCGIVQFHSPLTLILGPNGTGKTTIIEALKYVTTGVFPPNGKKEAAFVHDPKVAHELSVKAQVRLKFNDVRGQMCNITRSLQAEQKAKSITMKTLEGIIEMHLANGGAQTISSRCAEIDKEMVGLLGVSRPVLENVIFVHQEESNWPLNEGKALKEKFDDIFASTRYVKALDSIVKVRKGYVDDIKVLKEGIKFYKANKDKAEQLQGDMEETEVKYLASKTTVENIEKNLKPIEDKMEKIGEKEREIFELHTKIETLKSERTEMMSTMKELKESVKQEYTGSTERLRREILEHDQKVQEQEDNVHQLNKELKRVDADLDKATRIKNQHIMENGKLQQQAAQHMEHIEQRSSLVKQHADHYELEGFYGEITDAHYRKFERAMDDKSSELQQQGLTVKDEFEAQEAAIQERIEKQSMLQTQIETELKLKTERLNNNKSELQSINRQLAKVSASRDLLATVMQNLSRVELECDNAETAVDLESLRGDIKNLQAEKKSLDVQYKEIDSELQKMHAQSTTRTQLEMLRKDKATKEDNIRKLKTKHEDCIQNALGHMPNTKLRRAIDEFISKQTAEVNQTQATIQDMRIKVSSLRTEKKTLRDQLTQKKEELRGHEEKIYEECENQDFDEGLGNLSQRIKKNQEKHGLLSGSETVFKNYKNKLSKDNPPCPLCSRRFDSQSDVEELIHELETKLAQIPTTANQVMTDIQRFQQKYDRMQQLKPIKTAIEKLKQEDIPHLNKKINEMEKTIEELSDQIEEKEQQLEMQQVDEAMAKSVQPDMVTVDRLETELRDIDNKIVIQETRMVGVDPNRTVDMVTAERQRIQINIDKLGVELDSKQQQLTDHTDTIQRLKTSVNDLRARKLELDQQLQQRQKLEETKAQLTTDNKQLHEEIEDGRQQLKPLKLNINDLTKEKETITKNKEQQYDKNREKVNCVREHWTEVRNIQVMINRYVEDGVEDELQQSNEKMEDLARKVENLEKRRDECQSQLNSTKDQLAKQQILKNDLNVNLAIRKKQQQINEKDDAIKENSLELGDLDVRTMSRDKRDLRLKLDSLVKEKHTASGRQAGLEEEMRRLKKEITSELYGKAAEQYRDHVIKLRTTELAITDLEKYHQALDSTIMNYHNTKMKEINNIIAELWRNTYKGNDIERIEIRSDQEEAASLSKSRRVYHYRVVMIKGDAALDMRGRCSAGQKVLASLIIRLALAETFCLNCGILALDEPTTNLDRHNIESLAAALVEIIKSRRSQKNFQLICITHDEEFVEMLGRSEFVDEFVRVKKNPLGLSKLVSTSVHELHSR